MMKLCQYYCILLKHKILSNPQIKRKEAGKMLCILVLMLWSNACYAAKVLVIFPHSSEGHFAVMRTLVSELAVREHNVSDA